nr:MAG TPA: hypothetical protein [Caudoviricetes sp.]
MKIRKEIVLNKGENPKKNGRYLLVQFFDDGSVRSASDFDYTVAYGWNTCETYHGAGIGKKPNDGAYAWAELSF